MAIIYSLGDLERILSKNEYNIGSKEVKKFMENNCPLESNEYLLLFDLAETFTHAIEIINKLTKIDKDNFPNSLFIRACWKSQNEAERKKAINLYTKYLSGKVNKERLDNPVMIRYERIVREKRIEELRNKFVYILEKNVSGIDEGEENNHNNPFEKREISISVYNRSSTVRNKALESASFLCEINPTHKDFIASSTNNNYVEVHHLIPLAYQQYFKHSLDVVANLICLCTGCHKKLHLGKFIDKKEHLEYLYNNRQRELNRMNITISKEDLYSYYRNDFNDGDEVVEIE